MKDVSYSNKSKENYHPTLQFLSVVKGVQLIVLVLQPTALLFCFSLIALISVASSSSRQLFSAKKHDFPVTRQQTDQAIS